jgi:hypothetical protein
MRPVRPALIRKDTGDLVRDSNDGFERVRQRQGEVDHAIALSQARLSDTRMLLARIDAALKIKL